MLNIRGINKSYNGKDNVLSNINLYAKKGEVVGLVGLNGAGKSTLMKVISGATKIQKGNVSVDGKDIKFISGKARRDIAYLSTSSNTYQELTVMNNLELFRRLYGASYEEMKNVIKETEINYYLDKKVSKLSTGMKKKVDIACSTMHNYKLLLLDEPTNGLDIEARDKILAYLRKSVTPNKTMLITSHNIRDIEKICDRIYVLKNGEIIKETTIANMMDEANTEINKWHIYLYNREGLEYLLYSRGYNYTIKQNKIDIVVEEIEKQKAIMDLSEYGIISVTSEVTNLEEAILKIV